ncbi:MAG: hypothetical protein O2856_17715, partial [Planctomycetota bacterium]|nr:hypothetical protein [Planctomycetota bacterium]
MSHFTIDWSELSLQVMLTFGHFLWQGCAVAIVLVILNATSSLVSGRSRALRSHLRGEPAPDGSRRSADL